MAKVKTIDDSLEKEILHKSIGQNGFTKKVYGILCAQQFVTVLVVMAAIQIQEFGEFILNNNWLTLVCGVAAVTIIVLIGPVDNMTAFVPWNYRWLSAFTVCESYCIAGLCMFYPPVVAMAVMTFIVTLALMVYTWMAKEDGTIKMGTAVNLEVVLFVLPYLRMFIHENTMGLVLCALTAFCYGMIILIDNQIIAQRQRDSLPTEDYMMGAIALYYDMIVIFDSLLVIIFEFFLGHLDIMFGLIELVSFASWEHEKKKINHNFFK